VGKSTLLNRILGQKISITSPKPQTTRHQIIGIKTTDDAQYIYVDTPGLHRRGRSVMNRYMNRAASGAVKDVDVVVFVVAGGTWNDEDRMVLERLDGIKVPVILAVNKTDKLTNKGALLPHIDFLSQQRAFDHIIPISALKGENLAAMEAEIYRLLPVADPIYPDDQITDRSERFLAAEIIREKLMRRLNQELPYSVAVEIEKFTTEKEILHIGAVIWVERTEQKGIVVGKGGERLKAVGRDARLDMQRLFDSKVFLKLWVKVREGWSNDARALQSMGYDP